MSICSYGDMLICSYGDRGIAECQELSAPRLCAAARVVPSRVGALSVQPCQCACTEPLPEISLLYTYRDKSLARNLCIVPLVELRAETPRTLQVSTLCTPPCTLQARSGPPYKRRVWSVECEVRSAKSRPEVAELWKNKTWPKPGLSSRLPCCALFVVLQQAEVEDKMCVFDAFGAEPVVQGLVDGRRGIRVRVKPACIVVAFAVLFGKPNFVEACLSLATKYEFRRHAVHMDLYVVVFVDYELWLRHCVLLSFACPINRNVSMTPQLSGVNTSFFTSVPVNQ